MLVSIVFQPTFDLPMVIAQFNAHESAVVALETCTTGTGCVMVTAGSDGVIKLFAMDGRCIGFFGQVIYFH